MNGNFWADQRALARESGCLDNVLSFTAEHAEEFSEVFGEHVSFDPEGFEAIDQLHCGGFAHLAIGVADDDDFLAAFYRASQRERTHGAALRAGDDIPGIAQPD